MHVVNFKKISERRQFSYKDTENSWGCPLSILRLSELKEFLNRISLGELSSRLWHKIPLASPPPSPPPHLHKLPTHTHTYLGNILQYSPIPCNTIQPFKKKVARIHQFFYRALFRGNSVNTVLLSPAVPRVIYKILAATKERKKY